MLGIEVINICNYNCYFCGSQFVKSHDHRIISNETFFKIVDEAESIGIKHLDLTPTDGELFVDNTFIEKLKYAAPKFSIEFFTNFSLCTERVIDILKQLSQDNNINIKVSDYGEGDKEIFKKFTRQGDKEWDTYRKNLSYAKQTGLKLNINSRGENYSFLDLGINPYLEECPSTTNKVKEEVPTGVCGLQFIPRLHINGDLIYCLCGDNDNTLTDEIVLGNIYEQSLSELYLSNKRLKLFENQTKGIYNKSCINCEEFEHSEGNIDVYKMYAKIKRINK